MTHLNDSFEIQVLCNPKREPGIGIPAVAARVANY